MDANSTDKWVLKISGSLGLSLLLVMILLFLLIPVFSPPALADTPVSGDINTDTTWNSAGSPYVISGTVNVQTDLTIQSGVVVSFTANAQLNVNTPGGRLIANGAPGNLIEFTSANGICYWRGIFLESDNNQISYARVKNAAQGVYIDPNSSSDSITNSIFENNGGDGLGGCSPTPNPLSGAIIGSPDDSIISSNIFTGNNVAVYFIKAGGNVISYNIISGTAKSGLSLAPAENTRSADNQVLSNTVHHSGDYGISVALGSGNTIQWNQVYSNTGGGIRINDEEGASSINYNDVFSNTGPGLFITDTANIGLTFAQINENLVWDNPGGVYWDLNPANGVPLASYDIQRNVICRNTNYLFQNQNAGLISATPNWWGTNAPTTGAVGSGSQIQGNVNTNPAIVLTTTAALTTLPADGATTTTLTITLQSGSSTVPARARTIALATSRGVIFPLQTTLNAGGQATATFTAGTVSGPVVITVTDMCQSNPLTLNLTLQETDLGIGKTTALTQVIPGELITYTLPYTNYSATSATSVTITDTLPAGVVWVSDNAAGLGFTTAQTSPVVVWTRPSLPGGSNGLITLVGRAQTTGCNTVLQNTAIITTATTDSNPANNTAVNNTIQTVCADLQVTKTATPTQVGPGGLLTYTLTVSNAGGATAQNVILTDTLPITQVYWISDTGPARTPTAPLSNTAAIRWDIGAVGPGQQQTITLVVRVRNVGDGGVTCTPVGGEAILANRLEATSATPDALPGDNTYTTGPTGNGSVSIACADVTIRKTGPGGTVSPGQAVTYTIVYSNNGPIRAENVVITDVSPISGGVVTLLSGAALDPGQQGALTYVVPTDGSICDGRDFLTNTATIATQTPETDYTNNTATAGVSSAPRILCHDLIITKTISVAGASVGKVTTFTVAYRNTGVYTAPNTIITDFLDSLVQYAGDTFPGAAITTANTVQWIVGNLGPGQGGAFDIGVQPLATACTGATLQFTNTTEIQSSQPDIDPANNRDTAGPVVIPCGVDLSVVKDDRVGPGQPRLVAQGGEIVTYTLSVANVGGNSATGVTLTETLPAHTLFVGGSNSFNAASWTSIGGGQYTMGLGALNGLGGGSGPNGGLAWFIVRIDPSLVCGITQTINTAIVGGAQADVDPTDNTAVEDTDLVCQPFDLSVTKNTALTLAAPGQTVTYTLGYSNASPYTATGVILTDTLPVSTTYAGDNSGLPFSNGGAVLTWTIGAVGPHAGGSFVISATLSPAIPDGWITNTARIAGAQGEANPADNIAWAAIEVCSGVNLTLVKDDQVGPGQPRLVARGGDVVTYTLSLANIGNFGATGAIITETLPAGTLFVGGSNSFNAAGWTDIGGGRYTMAIGNVNGIGGGINSGLAWLVVRVNPALGCAVTQTINTAGIGGAQADVDPADNTAVEDTPLACLLLDLGVAKSAARPLASPGQTVTYTVSYTNNSPYTATGVILTDTLPVSTTYAGSTNPVAPVISGNNLLWTLGTLGPHTGGSFIISATLSPAMPNGWITNTVRIAGAQGETNPADNIAWAAIEVRSGVNLSLVKDDGVGPGQPRPVARGGEIVTYTLSLVNIGNFGATGVILTETLPAGTLFVGGSNSFNAAGWTDIGGGRYTMAIGNVNGIGGAGTGVWPNGGLAWFVVRVNPGLSCAVTQTINTAGIYGAESDIDRSDNFAVEDTDLACQPLQVSKNDGGLVCAAPGQRIEYTIVASNAAATAAGVYLVDQLPANTTFAGPVGTWTTGGSGQYSHTIGTLAGGASQSVGFWARVDPGVPTGVTAITNVVELWPGGVTAQTVTPLVHDAADLSVVKNDNIEMIRAEALETIARIEDKAGGPITWFEPFKAMSVLKTEALFVNPGDVISYSMNYVNVGHAAANVIITETLPANTTFVGPIGAGGWTAVNATTYIHTVATLPAGSGGHLDFYVRVASPFPAGVPGVTNTVQIGSNNVECDFSDNTSVEFTPVGSAPYHIYLPIIIVSPPPPTPTPTPTSRPPTATPTAQPRAHVADVAVDQITNQVFVASPRGNAVLLINGATDTYNRSIGVGNGPTGLAVLTSTNPSKVAVAHQYAANNWNPGAWYIHINDLTAHSQANASYVGAAPIRVTGNPYTSRFYFSNYYDLLPIVDGVSENRLAWVHKKAFQASYGIEMNPRSGLIYMAAIDTGELIIFDSTQAEADPDNYGACHNAPPDDDHDPMGDGDPRILRMVAVNQTTRHVFVSSPPDTNTGQTDSRVYVLDEAALLGPDGTNGQPPSDISCSWNFLRTAEEAALANPGRIAARPGRGWIKTVNLGATSAGEEGITVNPATGLVFVTDSGGDRVFVIQDSAGAAGIALVATLSGGSYGFDNPQGVDVNPLTNKVYVGNARSGSDPYGTVSVFNGSAPFSAVTVIPLH